MEDRIPPTDEPAREERHRTVVYGSPPPPAPVGVAVGAPPPAVPAATLYVLLAVAGGVLLVSFLFAAMGVDPSFYLTVSFIGVVMLVVVLIVGAAGSTDVSREGRIAMGVLAGVLALASFWSFATVASAPYATCGAIAAAPALFALRAFTVLRDGFLASTPTAAADV